MTEELDIMTMVARAVAAVTVVILGVAACGTAPPGNGDRSSPTPTPTSSSPHAGEVTLAGAVVAGVEPGCLLLDTGTADYLLLGLLLGGDRAVLEPGRQVEVRGALKPATVTTCQQGVPLEVHEVRPA